MAVYGVDAKTKDGYFACYMSDIAWKEVEMRLSPQTLQGNLEILHIQLAIEPKICISNYENTPIKI